MSYVFGFYAFDMLMAKVFSLLFALARRRLSQAIKLIKKTNSWIFWVGIGFFILAMMQYLVFTIIYLTHDENSNAR